jgi:hypothetical protein
VWGLRELVYGRLITTDRYICDSRSYGSRSVRNVVDGEQR